MIRNKNERRCENFIFFYFFYVDIVYTLWYNISMKGGKLMKKKQKKKLAKLIIKAITAIALLISAIAQLIQALN